MRPPQLSWYPQVAMREEHGVCVARGRPAVVVIGPRLHGISIELGIESFLEAINLLHRIRELGINITQACIHVVCTPHQQLDEVGMQLCICHLL
jgi:hypothetical protein